MIKGDKYNIIERFKLPKDYKPMGEVLLEEMMHNTKDNK
jgi:hypothetical protein